VTAGRITELLPRGCIDSDKLAVLGNAIYFKGAWRSKFDPRNTRDGTFYLHAFGHHVRAPFMSSGEPQYIACRPGYKVLRLPYALGRGHGGESRRCFSM
jgi:serpin B